jgi:hypothetical protein
MIIIKSSLKTVSANVWRRHIVSQKSIGNHSVYKHWETSCKRDVQLVMQQNCETNCDSALNNNHFENWSSNYLGYTMSYTSVFVLLIILHQEMTI